MLVSTAERMRESVRSNAMVARLGGDEFLIVVPDADVPQAQQVAARIVEAASVPTEWNGHALQIGASVGVSMAQPGDQAHTILQRADQAMYEAKRSGDTQVVMAG